MGDREEILKSLRGYLKHLRLMGIEFVPRPQAERRDPQRELEGIREEVLQCKACQLHATRKNPVLGEGNPRATLVFVGEAPGGEEDLQGRPFVGKAGELLTRIIQAMGLKREEVYITNIVKCRPPGNRTPRPAEIEACLPYLLRQLDIIRPKIICALGTVAAQTLLGTKEKITSLRGQFHPWKGMLLMPTYHPAFLLRNPQYKRDVWEDVKMIMREYEKLSQGRRNF